MPKFFRLAKPTIMSKSYLGLTPNQPYLKMTETYFYNILIILYIRKIADPSITMHVKKKKKVQVGQGVKSLIQT